MVLNLDLVPEIKMADDNSSRRLQQAQQQVGEVVDIMRVNVEKVNLTDISVFLEKEFTALKSGGGGVRKWLKYN